MSAQTLLDNAAGYRRDNSLLNLITVRDGNDLEPERIDIRAIEPVRNQENVEENEDNEQEIMKNIKLQLLQILKASTKENIEKGERLMKLEKGVAKAKIGRANNMLEKQLCNTKSIYTVIDAMLWSK